MIYGIQASKDVKLTSIARTLDEDIPLIKTVNRLSRREVKNPSEQSVLSATFNFFQRKAERLYR